MDYADVKKYVGLFQKKRVLVVGDVMLDEYIEGSAERISPEAPIPVLLQHSVRHALGGAGNVAANAASLGGLVTLVGVVGQDQRAKTLQQLCRLLNIKPCLVADNSRPTTMKIRFVSGHHQLVRIDIEKKNPVSDKTERNLIRAIHGAPQQDIVIISDYAKGCLTKPVVDALRTRFGSQRIIADLKPLNAHMFKNVFAVTPNLKETEDLTKIRATTDNLAERAAKLIGKKFKTSVILKRGEYGVTVHELGSKKSSHLRSRVLAVKDVTGAGDTLVAVLALMRAAGASLLEAAKLANYAAGIVIGYSGTHALSHDTLVEHLAKEK